MTNRERVFCTLSHQLPDKVPYNMIFTKTAHEKMAEYYADPDFQSKLGNCFTMATMTGSARCKQIGPDLYEDWFGVQWDRSKDRDIGVVCNKVTTEETLSSYVFPDPDDERIYEGIAQTIENAEDTVVVGNFGFTLFERAWTLVGMEDLLIGMVSNEEFVNELMDKILDFDLRVMKNACEFKLDGFRFGDDWGQQRGLIMGAPLWRKFIKPRIEQLYRYVKSQGKFVLIHSCGDVAEILPDLIECGVDIFNPFQPEVMDVYQVKKQYADMLSFYGGISVQRTLPYGTPKETRQEVERLLREIGHGGGYIASPSHDITADAKPENIAAMIDVLQNQ